MRKLLIASVCACLVQGISAEEKTVSGKLAVKNPLAAEAEASFRASFRTDNPKYWMQRIEQDEAMKLCGQYKDNPPAAVRQKIELAQKATIRYPVEGKLIGSWKEGEKIAAHGRGGHIGFVQPDAPMTPRGGNCYACHEFWPASLANARGNNPHRGVFDGPGIAGQQRLELASPPGKPGGHFLAWPKPRFGLAEISFSRITK